MRNGIVGIAVTGFLFLAGCEKEMTTETHSITSTQVSPADPTATETTVVETSTTAPGGTEEFAAGARELGRDISEGAKDLAVATGTALQRGGEKLEEAGRSGVSGVAQTSAGSASNGEVVFESKCISCHGADARGNTSMGRQHKIADLRTAKGMSDTQLANVIENGKPGGLSENGHKGKTTPQQINDLIAYIRSL